MKKSILFLWVLILMTAPIVTALSQFNTWGPATPFSDSLTDNHDATLCEISYYAGLDYYVFWVKSSDSASSDIVAKRYYAEEEPVIVLSDGQHHYRNPQVIPIQNWNFQEDTLFALFYEADSDGDFDIYYCFYTLSGLTPSQALTVNDQEESGMETNDAGGIIWENNGAIRFADLAGTYYGNTIEIENLMLVDSNLCSHPSLSHNIYGGLTEFLAWEKLIDGSSQILIKRKDLNSPDWFDNEILSSSGSNTGPRFSEGTQSEVPGTLTWNTTVEDSAAIYASDLEDMYLIPDFRQSAPFNPHCFNVIMLVSWLYDYSIVTFEREEQADIYGGEWGWSSMLGDYVNISNSAETDRNPYLFGGGYYGEYEDVINIWESYRNGHWQLYTALIPVRIFGGVNEPGKSNDFGLNAMPNPVGPGTKLSFRLSEGSSCRISVMSAAGNLVQSQDLGYFSKGKYEVPFTLLQSCSPGIYFVVLETGGKRQGIKVVKK
jgi:hypothetical protein